MHITIINFSNLAGAWAIQNVSVPQTTAVHSDTARAVGTSITSTYQPLWCILTSLTPCLLFIIFLSLTLTLLNVSAGQATVVTSTHVALANLSWGVKLRSQIITYGSYSFLLGFVLILMGDWDQLPLIGFKLFLYYFTVAVHACVIWMFP